MWKRKPRDEDEQLEEIDPDDLMVDEEEEERRLEEVRREGKLRLNFVDIGGVRKQYPEMHSYFFNSKTLLNFFHLFTNKVVVMLWNVPMLICIIPVLSPVDLFPQRHPTHGGFADSVVRLVPQHARLFVCVFFQLALRQ